MFQTLIKYLKDWLRFPSITNSPTKTSTESAEPYWQAPTNDADRKSCCKDAELVEFEWEAIFQTIKQHFDRNAHFTVLDVGCSAVGETQRRFAKAGFINCDIVGVDLHPRDSHTLPCSVLNLLSFFRGDGGRKEFDVVMTKRVLCNLSQKWEQVQAVEQMRAMTKKGGLTMLIEPDEVAHKNVSKARIQAGIPGLSKPEHNSYVDLHASGVLLGGQVTRRQIAPDYVIWTRLTYPLLNGGRHLNYASSLARQSYPKYGTAQQKRFGVYQLMSAIRY